jgi:hypothetical protein
MKRGYRLKDGAQIPTRPTTVEEIMASLHFGYGVTDKGAGRGFRDTYESWEGNAQWSYERGRAWATKAPRKLALKKRDGELNPAAVRLGSELSWCDDML